MGEQPLTRTERGSASLEFVLALPILWIVIVLAFGAAAGLLARQRVQVLVRERAVGAEDGPAGETVSERALLSPLRVSGTFQSRAGGAEADAVAQYAEQALARVSGVRSACFDGSKRRVTKFLPTVRLTLCLEVDLNSWTYAETKEQSDGLLGAVLGARFGSLLNAAE